jgi:hypothetical protein
MTGGVAAWAALPAESCESCGGSGCCGGALTLGTFERGSLGTSSGHNLFPSRALAWVAGLDETPWARRLSGIRWNFCLAAGTQSANALSQAIE